MPVSTIWPIFPECAHSIPSVPTLCQLCPQYKKIKQPESQQHACVSTVCPIHPLYAHIMPTLPIVCLKCPQSIPTVCPHCPPVCPCAHSVSTICKMYVHYAQRVPKNMFAVSPLYANYIHSIPKVCPIHPICPKCLLYAQRPRRLYIFAHCMHNMPTLSPQYANVPSCNFMLKLKYVVLVILYKVCYCELC